MIFYVCCVLNTKVMKCSKGDEYLLLQLNSVKNLEKFTNMEVFHPVSFDSLIDGYSDIAQYVYTTLTLNILSR